MGLFGHGGFFSKLNTSSGWRSVLKGIGLVGAGVLTGGLIGGTVLGMSAATAGGIVGGIGATGNIAGEYKTQKAIDEAKRQNAAAQAEIDKATMQAENERRAQLYSLRKQVGRPVGGANVGIYNNSGGSGTSSLSQYNGIVLG